MKAAIDLLRTNERKAPGQINFGEPNHRNRLSPSKRPLVQLFFILRNFFFQKKRALTDILVKIGGLFWDEDITRAAAAFLMFPWIFFFPSPFLFEVKHFTGQFGELH